MRLFALMLIVMFSSQTLSSQVWAAPRLPTEPTEIAPGQKLLIDDGTCPGGQIKELTGGFPVDRKTGQPRPGGGHTRRCIKR